MWGGYTEAGTAFSPPANSPPAISPAAKSPPAIRPPPAVIRPPPAAIRPPVDCNYILSYSLMILFAAVFVSCFIDYAFTLLGDMEFFGDTTECEPHKRGHVV